MLAAVDFTTVEVWSLRGLVTYYLLFVMDLKTRRVEFAGLTTYPDGKWMTQIARNLTDADDGFLKEKRFLVMDRNTKFCTEFKEILESSGNEPVLLPPRSPNLNAWIERFFGTLKSEYLDRMIYFGEASLRRAVREYVVHYNAEHNHQRLANGLIDPGEDVGAFAGKVECRKRLDGMLNYYYRDAA